MQQLHQRVSQLPNHKKMSESQQATQLLCSNNNNKSMNSVIRNSKDPFRLLINSRQVAFLTTMLPKNYSFIAQSEVFKLAPRTAKVPKQQHNFMQPIKKIASRDEIKSESPTKSSIRVPKHIHNTITQQDQYAIYQKYNNQKELSSFNDLSQPLRRCSRILSLLKTSKTSWPFREPVDPVALGIPHYRDIIKQPMDLSTIQNNLKTAQYITPTQFHADVAKIITNSYKFNASNTQFIGVTLQFEEYYCKITSQISPDIVIKTFRHHGFAPGVSSSKVSSLELKKSMKQSKQNNRYGQQVISLAQKKELGQNIKKLPKEYMKGVLDIVNQGREKMIGEFDLKELDLQIIRKLQKYVQQKLLGQTKPKQVTKKADSLDQKQSSFELGQQSES